MPDRAGLGFLGWIFGAVTVAVTVMAVAIVLGHVDGSLALDGPAALSSY